jgi:hypothetical protein
LAVLLNENTRRVRARQPILQTSAMCPIFLDDGGGGWLLVAVVCGWLAGCCIVLIKSWNCFKIIIIVAR